jgi:hypothetical protein
MGFFDTLVEGISSAVHCLATVADAASTVAPTIGAVGALLGEDPPLAAGDGPINETLRHNTELASNYLLKLAGECIDHKRG